ncbi:MAG: hypothetical protein IPM55_08420 [Acidobacteria bacterium]|nr:hypothetical protein [Acidobacteriota bacterium]
MTKIAADILKRVNELPEETRKKVEKVVVRHLEACRRVGVEPEQMDRVWIEAIEAVRQDEHFTDSLDEKWPEWEPLRSYDVYSSPADHRI